MATPVDTDAPALRFDAVTFSYGAAPLLVNVSFQVGRSESVGLLGTNGAGKSTILRLVAGLERPTEGRVLVCGRDLTTLKAEERCRRGVVLIRAGRGVFGDLTVAENLEMHGRLLRGKGRLSEGRDRALTLFPSLATRLRQPARSLSGGERQQLALARAVVAQPRLLCVDELSRGLAPAATEEMVGHLRSLNADGIALLVVEQSVGLAASVCARTLFLDRGTVRFDGPAARLLRRPDLARTVFFGAEPPT